MDHKYTFETMEPAMQKLWEKEQVYHFHENSSKPVFSIDTPPPTVSGSLHIGHVFSYTQAEMMARYRRMRGYEVFYPFGFDDNGLPTERLVEKEHRLRARDVERSKFQILCSTTAQRYEQDFQALWKSLGFSVDWSLQYRTVEEKSRRISQRAFLELAKQGKAYIKESPVLWCTQCRTSIAQAEMETSEQDSMFIYLDFNTPLGALTVATTRPELLFGCVCVFVHPDDERYAGFIGTQAKVPYYNFVVPVLAEETVDREKGTGAVLCASYGDSSDAQWIEKHKLPEKRVLLPDGTFAPEVPLLAGLNVIKARKRFIDELEQTGLVKKQEPIRHTVAVHERCGTAVEMLSSRQWYIDVLSEKERFLHAADEIDWYPASMKKRYQLWVENLKWDWCISRQRYFGVPFPVWYCKDCGKPAFAEEADLPVDPLKSSPKVPCSCGCTEFEPETAVLDTWATSSLTPLINARYGEANARTELLPMGMRAQSHDIIRTWTFYTIVRSLYHTGKLPWKALMISGFVLAKKGEKISKSKSNAVNSPQALVQTHSADAMRYWAANARLGSDTFFSSEELGTSKRFLTKLWNASRFAAMHLEDFDPTCRPAYLPQDRWILERVRETTGSMEALLDQYEIGQARHEVDTLFWTDFCDHYLELVKERLYQPETRGIEARRSAQFALYHTLLGILKLYAVYVPHITEAIYQQCFRRTEEAASIHLMQWEESKKADETLLQFGEELKAAVSQARRIKTERGISLKSELDSLDIRCSVQTKVYFEEAAADLHACTNAKKLSCHAQ